LKAKICCHLHIFNSTEVWQTAVIGRLKVVRATLAVGVFLDVTPYRIVNIYRRFGGEFYLRNPFFTNKIPVKLITFWWFLLGAGGNEEKF